MYCLEVIRSASFQSPPAKATPALDARDCSFHLAKRGLILHSACHRSTVFLPREAPNFKRVLRKLRRRTQAGRNRLIEAFF